MATQRHPGLAAVIEHCAPYWAGEYACAHTYFSGSRRSRDTDLRWMELQMFKEWTGSGVYGDRSVTVSGVIAKGLERLRRIEAGDEAGDLDAISELIRFGLDEFEHFKILYKLYRRIAPERRVAILDMGNLPQALRMVEMRQSYRETHPLGDTIVDLTEGGGLGMYFGIAKAFETAGSLGEDDKVIREFAWMTINDETGHMKHRVHRAMELELSAAQWEEVDRGLQVLFAQKLAERNEQLGDVFDRAELDAMSRDIEAGRAYVRANLGFLDEPLARAA